MALSFSDDKFDVLFWNYPISLVPKRKKPVWVFLVDMIRGMKDKTFYTKGGTTMVTVKQVGEVLLEPLKKTRRKRLPVRFITI